MRRAYEKEFYYLYFSFLVNEIQKLVPVIYFRFLLLFFTLLRSKNFFLNCY